MQSSEIGASDSKIAQWECLAILHNPYAHHQLPTIRAWQLVQLRSISADHHISRMIIGDGTAWEGKQQAYVAWACLWKTDQCRRQLGSRAARSSCLPACMSETPAGQSPFASSQSNLPETTHFANFKD